MEEIIDISDLYRSKNFVKGYNIETLYGDSDCSYHIPILSLVFHDLIKINGNIVVQHYLQADSMSIRTRSYTSMVHLFKNLTFVRSNFFTFKDSQKNIHNVEIRKGMLSYRGKIIACLTIDVKYLLSLYPIDPQNFVIDPSKLTLYIHSSFYTAPVLKNVIKNFEKLYVNKVLVLGVKVTKTLEPIEDLVYSSNFNTPKFKSLLETKRFLKQKVLNNYLHGGTET